MKALHEVRAVALTGYVEVAQFLGLDPFAMLNRVQISPTLLDDPELRLPAARAVELLEESARLSRCQSFGLLMAECRTFESLGPLTLLLGQLASLRDVLDATVEHRRQLNDIFELSVGDHSGTTLIEVAVLPQFRGQQVLDQVIAMTYVLLSGASRHSWKPRMVHFRHSAPDDPKIFNRFFSCPVQFESVVDGIECDTASLDRRLAWANAPMAQNAARLLAERPHLMANELPASERVTRSIALLLPAGRATVDAVALAMAISPRALQRSLSKEGIGFGELLTKTRRDVALRYLSHDSQTISSVAELTGFASGSSFTRWFISEFGLSPRRWRESNAASSNLNAA